MSYQKRLGKNLPPEYIRYEKGQFSLMPEGIIEVMARARVGSNGWPVMACLCRQTYKDGSFAALSREEIARLTHLTEAQVSRGLADLRERLIIEPVMRKTSSGKKRPDRSNYGHVARYRFTSIAWEYVRANIESSDDQTPI